MPTSLTSTFDLPHPHDVARTLSVLTVGSADPCWSTAGGGTWSWATRSPAGPVSMRFAVRGDAIEATAWGPGADWAIAAAPGLLGLDDDPGSFEPEGPVAAAAGRFPGFRLAASGRVADAAIAGICRRGVSAFEAGRSWTFMVEAFGDDAPGPVDLRLPPAPRRLAAAEPYELHVMGLEQGRADEVRRVASHSPRLEVGPDDEADAAIGRLAAIAGLGPDAVAHARSVALGDPDAVPVIDPHHLAVVVRTLHADESDPVDVDLLLEPYRPQRGRVVRLLGLTAPPATPATP